MKTNDDDESSDNESFEGEELENESTSHMITKKGKSQYSFVEAISVILIQENHLWKLMDKLDRQYGHNSLIPPSSKRATSTTTTTAEVGQAISRESSSRGRTNKGGSSSEDINGALSQVVKINTHLVEDIGLTKAKTQRLFFRSHARMY